MSTTMIRVRNDIHTALRRLAEEQHITMQDVLSRALEDYRRAVFFERARQSYADLRADPGAWELEMEERAAWDGTLMDGLQPAPEGAATTDMYDVAY